MRRVAFIIYVDLDPSGFMKTVETAQSNIQNTISDLFPTTDCRVFIAPEHLQPGSGNIFRNSEEKK